MKICAIKLGARIAAGGTSGGSGEALAILNMLAKHNEVHAYTKILPKDDPIDGIVLHDLIDNHEYINDQSYDALVVINGSVNYFGGVDDPYQTLNYKIINNFEGKVFYILCDPNLPLKQIWPSVEKKEWSSNYKKSDIEIVRDDIIYISQPKDVDKILKDIQKHKISISTCYHYPLEKFPLMEECLPWKPLAFRDYDLLYGGTYRQGKRVDDMIKFYFDMDEFRTCMFGKIKLKDFPAKKINGKVAPEFETSVPYQLFNEKMSNSVATVIIGDKYYKEVNDLAQRIYESVLSGVITFIDSDYDKEKRVFTNPILRDILYVDDATQVKDRLNKIKSLSENEFLELLTLQYKDVIIDVDDYCSDFSNLLK